MGPGEVPLAQCQAGVLWSVSGGEGSELFRSALPLPSLGRDEGFHMLFNGDRFLELLPLLHYLRRAVRGDAFDGPPLRACFIFDDPNLHWPSYGFLDYREIVARAKKFRYHVSFATIPLDTWYTHAGAARIFRDNPGQVSLCIHGNNHTKRELARSYVPANRQALLRQAIRRIERLEAKSGVRICRLMVPPHGACSEDMLQELPNAGFEGACVSHSSLWSHNRDRAWSRRLGYFPSEIIGVCPVLPRWGMTPDVKATILVAAFLGQPIILRGHHKDVKGGLELLDELAAFINGFGDVRWCNLSALSRFNVQWRLAGKACWLRPFSRNVEYQVPEAVRSLTIDPLPGALAQERWEVGGQDGAWAVLTAGTTLALDTVPKGFISVQLLRSDSVRSETPELGPTMATVLRRVLTEARDRLRL